MANNIPEELSNRIRGGWLVTDILSDEHSHNYDKDRFLKLGTTIKITSGEFKGRICTISERRVGIFLKMSVGGDIRLMQPDEIEVIQFAATAHAEEEEEGEEKDFGHKKYIGATVRLDVAVPGRKQRFKVVGVKATVDDAFSGEWYLVSDPDIVKALDPTQFEVVTEGDDGGGGSSSEGGGKRTRDDSDDDGDDDERDDDDHGDDSNTAKKSQLLNTIVGEKAPLSKTAPVDKPQRPVASESESSKENQDQPPRPDRSRRRYLGRGGPRIPLEWSSDDDDDDDKKNPAKNLDDEDLGGGGGGDDDVANNEGARGAGLDADHIVGGGRNHPVVQGNFAAALDEQNRQNLRLEEQIRVLTERSLAQDNLIRVLTERSLAQDKQIRVLTERSVVQNKGHRLLKQNFTSLVDEIDKGFLRKEDADSLCEEVMGKTEYMSYDDFVSNTAKKSQLLNTIVGEKRSLAQDKQIRVLTERSVVQNKGHRLLKQNFTSLVDEIDKGFLRKEDADSLCEEVMGKTEYMSYDDFVSNTAKKSQLLNTIVGEKAPLSKTAPVDKPQRPVASESESSKENQDPPPRPDRGRRRYRGRGGPRIPLEWSSDDDDDDDKKTPAKNLDDEDLGGGGGGDDDVANNEGARGAGLDADHIVGGGRNHPVVQGNFAAALDEQNRQNLRLEEQIRVLTEKSLAQDNQIRVLTERSLAQDKKIRVLTERSVVQNKGHRLLKQNFTSLVDEIDKGFLRKEDADSLCEEVMGKTEYMSYDDFVSNTAKKSQLLNTIVGEKAPLSKTAPVDKPQRPVASESESSKENQDPPPRPDRGRRRYRGRGGPRIPLEWSSDDDDDDDKKTPAKNLDDEDLGGGGGGDDDVANNEGARGAGLDADHIVGGGRNHPVVQGNFAAALDEQNRQNLRLEEQIRVLTERSLAQDNLIRVLTERSLAQDKQIRVLTERSVVQNKGHRLLKQNFTSLVDEIDKGFLRKEDADSLCEEVMGKTEYMSYDDFVSNTAKKSQLLNTIVGEKAPLSKTAPVDKPQRPVASESESSKENQDPPPRPDRGRRRYLGRGGPRIPLESSDDDDDDDKKTPAKKSNYWGSRR